MVRPQPPRPEAAHHVDKLNLDFNRRHIVKHFLLNIHSHDKFNDLLNIHSHDKFNDLLNIHGNVNSAFDDQHDNVLLYNLHLPILKGRSAEVG